MRRLRVSLLVTSHHASDPPGIALPRGGVPVAFGIARALDVPMDVFVVRKLGVPGHEELALGAIATGGTRVRGAPLIESIGLPPGWLEAIDAKDRRELERRERAYRGERLHRT
jgi:putative phosphoribosyl transferase